MSKKITLINDIKSVDNISQDEKILFNTSDLKIEELYTNSWDISIPLEFRKACLESYCNKHPEESPNIINRLNSMYLFSYSKNIENYLYEIATNSNLDIYLRLECAKSLTYKDGLTKGFEALDILCKDFDSSLATPCRIDAIILLLTHKSYWQKGLEYFCNVINDSNIEPLYRYKTIISLEFKLTKLEDQKNYTRKACTVFLENEKNPITYRILSCQYLLRKCEIDEKTKEQIEHYLLEFARDDNLNVNVRADAVDVLLQSGSDSNRKEAANLILILGAIGGTGRTVFDNSQNVHHRSIEESANKILEFLNTIPSKNKEGNEIEFDYVRKYILELVEKRKTEMSSENYKEFKEKIEASLTRIFIDRAVYSRYTMSLILILTKIWCYIEGHQYEEEMKKRVLEELYDSSEVCSTGYAFRIVNIISGFGELSIGISFEDQIVANLAVQLNSKIRDIFDEDFRTDVITEMMIEPSNFKERSNFLKFFRENISKIRESMFQDFKDYMTDTDYDMYFRKAIIHYEGCN